MTARVDMQMKLNKSSSTRGISAFAVVLATAASSSDAFAQSHPSCPLASRGGGRVQSRPVKSAISYWKETTSLVMQNDPSIEGTSSSSSLNSDEDSEAARLRRKGMSAALTAVYFTVMGAKCALPAVMPMLTSAEIGLTFPSSSLGPKQHLARLLLYSTMAVAVGKILLGPFIDHFGGIASLQAALAVLAALLAIISSSQSFVAFAACWILVDFIFSACWAACINAIHQSFPKQEWSFHVSSLAAAARTGNAAAFTIFASLLTVYEANMRQPWRPIFAVSAGLQMIPLALLSYFGRQPSSDRPIIEYEGDSTSAPMNLQNKPSFHASLAVLRREAARPAFWLHLTSRSALMVFASFSLFVPTLLNQIYHASMAYSARVGSVYALGCLLSVTIGSQVYARLSQNRKRATLVALLGMATVSSLSQLGHVMGWWILSAQASAGLFFLWGFAFAIPFYLPPSLYALARGGKESSATIADVFDIGGFALLALFNGFVAGISHNTLAAWVPVFQMTTACSVVSLISLWLATILE